jgi:hypothetical protein
MPESHSLPLDEGSSLDGLIYALRNPPSDFPMDLIVHRKGIADYLDVGEFAARRLHAFRAVIDRQNAAVMELHADVARLKEALDAAWAEGDRHAKRAAELDTELARLAQHDSIVGLAASWPRTMDEAAPFMGEAWSKPATEMDPDKPPSITIPLASTAPEDWTLSDLIGKLRHPLAYAGSTWGDGMAVPMFDHRDAEVVRHAAADRLEQFMREKASPVRDPALGDPVMQEDHRSDLTMENLLVALDQVREETQKANARLTQADWVKEIRRLTDIIGAAAKKKRRKRERKAMGKVNRG